MEKASVDQSGFTLLQLTLTTTNTFLLCRKTDSASLDNNPAWKVITALQFPLIHKCMRII